MSSELPKYYEPAAAESAIYERWLANGLFHAEVDDRPADRRYVIMMPLPNVTGALHMGHAMDNVMQDLLIRWHRMRGDNTLWMPGIDHAGIATQAVVEKRLKELEGMTRHDVGREGLMSRIWAWKESSEKRIIQQQQRMGCSCDWERHRFTMDEICARAVRHFFFRMFSDGLIFRGKRLVNWDVFLQTSVSDDEVYHETVQGHFWHLKYPVIDPKPGEPTHVTVATTRPETMLGDTAVAVHPDPAGALDALIARAQAAGDEDDARALSERKRERLAVLVQLRDMAQDGRHLMLPLVNRRIPLICDTWPKPELGSGCVKITPAHDPNDYDVWTRHKAHIDIINILQPDGSLNGEAGPYRGLDRFEARERVVADLDAQGLLAAVEDREVEIGHSDRSKTPVEPYLSDQWFIRMGDVDGGVEMGAGTPKAHRAPGLVQAAMDAVTDGRVSIHPARYTKTYLDWLGEKRDWPISRQLWWGHQIPVWSKRCRWGQVDREALRALAADNANALSARIHLIDDVGSFALDEVAEPPPADDCVCAIDVCLLSADPALSSALEALGYTRDDDVLDTWFSSALWPFSTLGWPDPTSAGLESDLCDTFYPGSCLVTGRDIITLWVARMVLAGLYCLGDIPFSDVFIHANILDGKGERMSKSKGNGIDPVDIIGAYGTDAMRYVLCDMQTGTQDIRLPVTAICPRCQHENDLTKVGTGRTIFVRICNGCREEFDVLGTMPDVPSATLTSKRFEVGRAFCTKLWNSARFALMNFDGEIDGSALHASDLALEDRWVLDQLDAAVGEVDSALAVYNPNAAVGAVREFFWGALCDWYLELIKPRLSGTDAASKGTASAVLAYCLDQVLRLLHPFVPFITEHLWAFLSEAVPRRSLGQVADAPPSEMLITAAWPTRNPALEAPDLRENFSQLQEITRVVREVRSTGGISPRVPLRVTLKCDVAQGEVISEHQHVITHLAKVSELTVDPEAVRQPGTAVKLSGALEIHVHDVVDEGAERERLAGARAKTEKEVARCEKKLANERFVANAPEAVVTEQRERLARYRANLAAIDEAIAQLG